MTDPATTAPRARRVSRRSLERSANAGESRRTVLVALVVNALITAAKAVGGLMTGSSAMLAEAAHSLADTVNQGFLLVSITQGRQPPNPEQPFGYARERYVWTFIASVSMFLAGAVFAIGYGIYELQAGGEQGGGYTVAYAVLVLAFLAEGVSWLRAARQTRREARAAGLPYREYVRMTRDPNVKMVLLEDSAALVGVAIAAAGLALSQATGARAWDAGASIAVGLLLVSVAMTMARYASRLLIGAAARPDERDALERTIEADPGVDRVVELLTMVLGPNALLVAARIDLADELCAEEIEHVSERIERALREAVPDVTEVFLDPTAARRS